MPANLVMIILFPYNLLNFKKLSDNLLAIPECWRMLLHQEIDYLYNILAHNQIPQCGFEYLR